MKVVNVITMLKITGLRFHNQALISWYGGAVVHNVSGTCWGCYLFHDQSLSVFICSRQWRSVSLLCQFHFFLLLRCWVTCSVQTAWRIYGFDDMLFVTNLSIFRPRESQIQCLHEENCLACTHFSHSSVICSTASAKAVIVCTRAFRDRSRACHFVDLWRHPCDVLAMSLSFIR